MPFEIDGTVRAIDPVVVTVVGRVWFANDGSTSCYGSLVVSVAVIDEELRRLRDASDAYRTAKQLLPRLVTADAAHRNHALPERELGVLDDPVSTEFERLRRERLAELQAANIRARDVALVHGSGFLIFGVWF